METLEKIGATADVEQCRQLLEAIASGKLHLDARAIRKSALLLFLLKNARKAGISEKKHHKHKL